jgi:uncharacterized protein
VSAPLRVQVAYAAPGIEQVIEVTVPPGTLLCDAVAASGIVARAGIDAAAIAYAIHGQRAHPTTPLRDGDRIELLRPLRADPKSARRDRAAAHPVPRAAPRTRIRTR